MSGRGVADQRPEQQRVLGQHDAHQQPAGAAAGRAELPAIVMPRATRSVATAANWGLSGVDVRVACAAVRSFGSSTGAAVYTSL
jgi:hypothetical protein